jgi:oligopeptide transport system substrate-binding protein
MPGHSPGIALPYDPGQARQLLAEAGYPGGRGFPVVDSLVFLGNKPHMEYLQAQWHESLGVRIAREATEWVVYLDRMNREPPHVYVGSWGADYSDPNSFLTLFSIRRWSRWLNQAYEGLIEEARSALDQSRRMKLYGRADRILVEEAAIVPLTYGREHLLLKPWVSRFPISAIRPWFWKDVIIEPH